MEQTSLDDLPHPVRVKALEKALALLLAANVPYAVIGFDGTKLGPLEIAVPPEPRQRGPRRFNNKLKHGYAAFLSDAAPGAWKEYQCEDREEAESLRNSISSFCSRDGHTVVTNIDGNKVGALMVERGYLVAHAPAEPQFWFKPEMPACPAYRVVGEDGTVYPSAQAAEQACDDNFGDNYQEIEAWKQEQEKQRRVQWPIAWAREMIKRLPV